MLAGLKVKSNYTKTMIALATTHWMVDCLVSIWPIFKYLANLDLARAGLIITLATLVGAATQPLFGILSDHGHRRSLILGGACLVGVGMLLGPASLLRQSIGEAQYYWLLFAIMMTSTIGASMFHPAAASSAGDVSHNRRSTLIAIFIASGMFGMACSHGFFSFVFRVTGGHTEYILILTAVLAVLASRWCHPGKPHAESTRETRRNQLKAIRRPLAILFVFHALTGAMFHGFAFLMPEFLELRGCPDWMIRGGGYLFYVTGSSVLMLCGGPLADRFGRHRLLAIFSVAAVSLLYVMILLPGGGWGMYVALLFVAGGFGGAVNPMGLAIGQRLAPQCASTISGILLGLAWAAASPAFWVIGILAERLGVINALLWVGTLGFVGLLALLVFVLQRRE